MKSGVCDSLGEDSFVFYLDACILLHYVFVRMLIYTSEGGLDGVALENC